MSGHPAFNAVYQHPIVRAGDMETKIVSIRSPPHQLVGYWKIEEDLTLPTSSSSSPSSSERIFNCSTGDYIVPTDGLYTISVDLIPIGVPRMQQAHPRRHHVQYAVRVTVPRKSTHHEDVDVTVMDVGTSNFGQILHLQRGSLVGVMAMPCAELGRHNIRLRIQLIQRKAKVYVPQLTRKQLKRKRKMRRRRRKLREMSKSDDAQQTSADDSHRYFLDRGGPGPSSISGKRSGFDLKDEVDVRSAEVRAGRSDRDGKDVKSESQVVLKESGNDNESSDDDEDEDDSECDDESDSDWEKGFESDTTDDEIPHSTKNVNERLAKRFKVTVESSHLFHDRR